MTARVTAELAMRVRVPIRLLSEANQRGHWSKGAGRAREQRQAVTAAFIDAGARVEVHSKVTNKKTGWVSRWRGAPACDLIVRITRVAPRELDDDNLVRSAKAVRDQVAELLGVDDRDRRVTWVTAQQKGEPGEHACLITVEVRA